jgi:acetyl esterase/lipase
MMHFNKILILNQKIMEHFFDAFLPNTTVVERRDPKISPYYENLEPFRGKLPKAIFTVGTEDPFLDDSISMGMKWMIAGGEAVVRLYSGAPHGFIGFPPDLLKEAGEALADTQTFIQDCLNAL